jgi:hypothetical protein
MPERTNQIIPVPLFHSSSTGDSTILALNPVSQAQALPEFGMPRLSWHLEMHRRDIGFNRGFHSTSQSPVNLPWDTSARIFLAFRRAKGTGHTIADSLARPAKAGQRVATTPT